MPTPTNGLLPKDLTRVSDLIARTGCAGEGVTVAVLDTGVDPGAAGLRGTPDGRGKVVDLVDCTGCGDVDTSVVERATAAGTLRGLSGRTLRLGPGLQALNAERDFRVGVKAAYDLFPSGLVRRLRAERRKAWGTAHRARLNAVRSRLNAARAQDAQASERPAPTPRRLEVEELEAQQAALVQLEKDYADTGPIYDCVVFHDGQRWRAVVDTTETGDLAQCPVLEDYAVRCQYAEFGPGTLLHYAVNIYADGDVLSIVVDGGEHGTHVAGILAANFPEAPEMNGLAPAAQIVSLKIGDTRLSSMETHRGIMRALAYLLAHSEPALSGSGSPSAAGSEESSNLASAKAGSTVKTKECPKAGNSQGQDGKKQDEETSDSCPEGSASEKKNLARPVPGAASASHTRPHIRIDVANMSFGEPSREYNSGRFVETLNHLVYKHNVLFVCSAGNNGPALTSVSAPGGTSNACIGVGAYITPEMLTQAYSVLDFDYAAEVSEPPASARNGPSGVQTSTLSSDTESAEGATPQSRVSGVPDRSVSVLAEHSAVDVDSERDPVYAIPYTWCSRGPVADGALGVNICAPGGAIAPVPMWMLQKKRLLNGTSMASPSAAGAIACILSFVKRRRIRYTSMFIRRAIECTARPLGLAHLGARDSARGNSYFSDLIFAGGNGSIDALATCQYLERFAPGPAKDFAPVNGLRTASVASSGCGAQVGSLTGGKDGIADRQAHEVEMLSPRYWEVDVRVSEMTGGRKDPSKPGVGCMNTTQGIYLRGEAETNTPQRVHVLVKPVSPDDESELTKSACANMELLVYLESSCPWVKVPASLLLMGTSRAFPVGVDPTALEAGMAHFAQISGYLQPASERGKRLGPLFKVPVTVTKPEPLLNGSTISPLCSMHFYPGTVVRRFYTVPVGATYVKFRVTAGSSNFAPRPAPNADVVRSTNQDNQKSLAHEHWGGDESPEAINSTPVSTSSICRSAGLQSGNAGLQAGPWTPQANSTSNRGGLVNSPSLEKNSSGVASSTADTRNFEVHLMQILPQSRYSETESHHCMTLRPGTEKTCYATVSGGSVIELCVAQSWSSPGHTILERVEMQFCGLRLRPSVVVTSPGAACFPRVEVFNELPATVASKATLATQNFFSPSAILHSIRRVLPVQKCTVRSLSNRDKAATGGPLAQLKLEYAFEVYDNSSSVSISFPEINLTVYESEVDGGPYVIVVDQNRRAVFASDIYPRSYSLSKGTYFVDAYLCHESVEELDRLRDLRAYVDFRLGNEVKLESFQSKHSACLGVAARKLSKTPRAIESGEGCAFYIAAPRKSQIPRWAVSGDTLVGNLLVDKPGDRKRGIEVPVYTLLYPVHSGTVLKKFVRPPLMKPSDKQKEPEVAKTDSDRDTEAPSLIESSPSSPRRSVDISTGSEVSVKSKTGDEPDKDEDQWLRDAIRKAKVRQLKTLLRGHKFDRFDALMAPLLTGGAIDLELLGLNLERLDAQALLFGEDREMQMDEFKALACKVVTAADGIIERVNSTELAAEFYMLPDPEGTNESAKRKKLDERKAHLLAALFRKARIVERMIPVAKTEGGERSGGDDRVKKNDENETFVSAFKQLRRWISTDGSGSMPPLARASVTKIAATTSEEVALFGAKREMRRLRYGVALKIMDTFYGSPPFKQPFTEKAAKMRVSILKALEWEHAADGEERRKVMRFPTHWASY